MDYATIRCELFSTPFKNMPQYGALSYTWGPPEPSGSILLDGRPFMVRENLWSALCHLRLPKRDRFLWIDAICIDQGNILERNHQVKRIGSIYEGASKVLIWLGPQKDQSDVALSFIEDIGRAAQNNWESLPIYEDDTDGKALDFDSPNFNNDRNLTFASAKEFDKAFVTSNIHEKEWASVRPGREFG